MPERLEAVVSGKVQGVSYRNFVERTARALELTGTVRNMPDGTVQVIAEGTRGNLEVFIACLKEGPSFASVNEVVVTWKSATGAYDNFSAIYSGMLG